MKKIKNNKILIIMTFLIAAAMIFSACAVSKTSITNSDFQSKASALSYQYQDTKSSYEDNSEIISSTTAFESSGSDILWSFDFIVLDSVNNAKNMFLHNKSNFEGESGTSLSFSGTNYSSYERTSDGLFMYVAYIDNTLVYSKVNEQYKDKVKAVFLFFFHFFAFSFLLLFGIFVISRIITRYSCNCCNLAVIHSFHNYYAL